MEAALVPQVPVSTDSGSNSQRDAGIYETHQKGPPRQLEPEHKPSALPRCLAVDSSLFIPIETDDPRCPQTDRGACVGMKTQGGLSRTPFLLASDRENVKTAPGDTNGETGRSDLLIINDFTIHENGRPVHGQNDRRLYRCQASLF